MSAADALTLDLSDSQLRALGEQPVGDTDPDAPVPLTDAVATIVRNTVVELRLQIDNQLGGHLVCAQASAEAALLYEAAEGDEVRPVTVVPLGLLPLSLAAIVRLRPRLPFLDPVTVTETGLIQAVKSSTPLGSETNPEAMWALQWRDGSGAIDGVRFLQGDAYAALAPLPDQEWRLAPTDAVRVFAALHRPLASLITA